MTTRDAIILFDITTSVCFMAVAGVILWACICEHRIINKRRNRP